MILSIELRAFVDEQEWTFAKTYAHTWPHEYLVRDRVDNARFELLVRHIRTYGYLGSFYGKPITYFDEAGMVYWTMGAPIEETTIINRCKKEDSYESRLRDGTLPESKGTRSGTQPVLTILDNLAAGKVEFRKDEGAAE